MKLSVSIQTSERDSITVCLYNTGKQIDCVKQTHASQAQQVLPALEALLDRHDVALGDIRSIKVDCGPGSFTGVRVGVSIANTLATLLGVPVNNLPKGALASPKYARSKFDSTSL